MKLLRICSSVFLIIGFCAIGHADEQFPFLATVAKKSVNIRAGANTNFEVADQLAQGTEVIVLAKSFDWYKVQLPLTAKSFIRADYLKLTQNPFAELIGDKVNIRVAPNSESSSLGIIKKGDTVKVISQVNGWWQIEPPVQAAGWIRQDFLAIKAGKVDPSSIKPNSSVAQQAVVPDLKLMEVKGRLKVLAESKEGMRYELVVDDHNSYYVQSVPNINRFKGAQVRINGFIVKDKDSLHEHPVLQVANISLLL